HLDNLPAVPRLDLACLNHSGLEFPTLQGGVDVLEHGSSRWTLRNDCMDNTCIVPATRAILQTQKDENPCPTHRVPGAATRMSRASPRHSLSSSPYSLRCPWKAILAGFVPRCYPANVNLHHFLFVYVERRYCRLGGAILPARCPDAIMEVMHRH